MVKDGIVAHAVVARRERDVSLQSIVGGGWGSGLVFGLGEVSILMG